MTMDLLCPTGRQACTKYYVGNLVSSNQTIKVNFLLTFMTFILSWDQPQQYKYFLMKPHSNSNPLPEAIQYMEHMRTQ